MSGKLLLGNKRALMRELGRGALDDRQIDAVGRREFKRRWGGVFASDGLPKLLPNHYYVVNSGFVDGPGAHWVGLYVTPRGRAYIYDSFSRGVRKLMWAAARDIARQGLVLEAANGVADQRGSSEICGHLSLSWLMAVRDKGVRAALEGPVERVMKPLAHMPASRRAPPR